MLRKTRPGKNRKAPVSHPVLQGPQAVSLNPGDVRRGEETRHGKSARGRGGHQRWRQNYHIAEVLHNSPRIWEGQDFSLLVRKTQVKDKEEWGAFNQPVGRGKSVFTKSPQKPRGPHIFPVLVPSIRAQAGRGRARDKAVCETTFSWPPLAHAVSLASGRWVEICFGQRGSH